MCTIDANTATLVCSVLSDVVVEPVLSAAGW